MVPSHLLLITDLIFSFLYDSNLTVTSQHSTLESWVATHFWSVCIPVIRGACWFHSSRSTMIFSLTILLPYIQVYVCALANINPHRSCHVVIYTAVDHPTGIQVHNHLHNVGQSPWSLRNHGWDKRPGTVSGDIHSNRPVVRIHGFLGRCRCGDCLFQLQF